MTARCPSCRAPMQPFAFRRKLGGELTVDLCLPCQGIWFDAYESLQLAPAGIVELFRLIHAQPAGQRLPLAASLACPRCDATLVHARDIVRSGRFNYHRCAAHGRFTSFGQFLVEKGFVRQLTGAELKQLRPEVAQLRCSSCGAPIDIRRDSACAHCAAPLAILDADAVARALAEYRAAGAVPPPPSAVPPDASLRVRGGGSVSTRDGDVVDLLVEGASTLCGMLGE